MSSCKSDKKEFSRRAAAAAHCRADILLLIGTGYYLLHGFRGQDQLFSEKCPDAFNYWLPVAFIQFYALQLLMITYIGVNNKYLRLILFSATTYGLVPWMTLFNFYGNWLLEQIRNECVADQVAKTYNLTFVVLTYVAVFIYLVFVFAIREAMSRYFICVEVLSESEIYDFLYSDEEDS